MRLRDFISSRGIRQVSICAAAAKHGHKLGAQDLCAIIKGRLKTQPRLALSIRDALHELHCLPKDVAEIDELRPFDLEVYPPQRLPLTPKKRPPPSAAATRRRSPLSRGKA